MSGLLLAVLGCGICALGASESNLIEPLWLRGTTVTILSAAASGSCYDHRSMWGAALSKSTVVEGRIYTLHSSSSSRAGSKSSLTKTLLIHSPALSLHDGVKSSSRRDRSTDGERHISRNIAVPAKTSSERERWALLLLGRWRCPGLLSRRAPAAPPQRADASPHQLVKPPADEAY